MTLSEIKQLLATNEIRLTRSLGQNFLHDGNQLRRIVRAAELKRTDNVLEIGPGLGPLTELLLAQARLVLAVEKDVRLVALLRQRFESTAYLDGQSRAEFRLVHDDALEYLRREPIDWSGWKLVSNLPYSIASPALVELAWTCPGPDRMVATLQLEVAQRLMAGPGNKDYGVLTLLIQLDYQLVDSFKISAGCFFPAPDVDSACVTLVRRATPLLSGRQREAFAMIVKRSFSQRRKMMAKLLKQDWPVDNLQRAFGQLGLDPQTRAETVSLKQFVSLANLLHE